MFVKKNILISGLLRMSSIVERYGDKFNDENYEYR